ncbi:TPA: hypothetical protein H1008_01740 [archaeon]|nr:hypothetical protein [Candidatus Undinarchaeales archaeon SRR5007147.bin71]
MGLEEVEKEIHKRIESKSKAIENLGEKEANSIIAEARDKIKSLTSERNKNIENVIKGLDKKGSAFENLQARKIDLDMRKDIMETAYSRAFVKASKIPATKRKIFLKELLKKGKKEIEAVGVCTNENDKGIVKTLDPKLKNLGIIETAGGIILVTKDGKVQVDYTFETIFEETRKTSLKGVSDILFGK